MARKKEIGTPIRCIRLSRDGKRETLGDLDYRGSSRQYYQSVLTAMRDGAIEQRAGGGVRIIRKRTPE